MKVNNEGRATFALVGIRESRKAALFVISLMLACSGKTNDPVGSLSTCGNSCSDDQVRASCSSACSKLAGAGCSQSASVSECTESCTKRGTSTDCSSKQVDLLRCLEPIMPTCTNAEPDFGTACNALAIEVERCSRAALTGAGGSSLPDDPSICPDIPRPADLGACVEASASGAAPIEGVDAALACTSSCHDSMGNLWEAQCNGSACTCSYNRERSCDCVITSTGVCRSCCPGTRAQ